MVVHDTPDSTNIARLIYNDETGVLDVEFRSGKTYRYHDVDYDTWNGLIEADSVGRYFNQNIRDRFKQEVI